MTFISEFKASIYDISILIKKKHPCFLGVFIIFGSDLLHQYRCSHLNRLELLPNFMAINISWDP